MNHNFYIVSNEREIEIIICIFEIKEGHLVKRSTRHSEVFNFSKGDIVSHEKTNMPSLRFSTYALGKRKHAGL